MTLETRIALFLVVELLAALRATDPDTFKQWIAGGVADLGEPARAGAAGRLVQPVADAGQG